MHPASGKSRHPSHTPQPARRPSPRPTPGKRPRTDRLAGGDHVRPGSFDDLRTAGQGLETARSRALPALDAALRSRELSAAARHWDHIQLALGHTQQSIHDAQRLADSLPLTQAGALRAAASALVAARAQLETEVAARRPSLDPILGPSKPAPHPPRLPIEIPFLPDLDAPEKTCGTPIEAETGLGNTNDIRDAVDTVANTWGSVINEQDHGVNNVQRLAAGTSVHETPLWEKVLGDVVGIGLVMAFGEIADLVGTSLGLIVRDLVHQKNLSGAAIAEIEKVTQTVHRAVTHRFSTAISKDLSGAGLKSALQVSEGSSHADQIVREAFFDLQSTTLIKQENGAKTNMKNSSGDFDALETTYQGAGFAALEAYRNHLECRLDTARAIQERHTLSMWASYLARLDHGSCNKDTPWCSPDSGVDLKDDLLGNGTARGVLDLAVEWNESTGSWAPPRIHSAAARGLSQGLRNKLTGQRLKDLPELPIMAHGPVIVENAGPMHEYQDGELRVGRNEGGAVFFTASGKGQVMIEHASDGGATDDGAESLLAMMDDLRLPEVK